VNRGGNQNRALQRTACKKRGGNPDTDAETNGHDTSIAEPALDEIMDMKAHPQEARQRLGALRSEHSLDSETPRSVHQAARYYNDSNARWIAPAGPLLAGYRNHFVSHRLELELEC
jgi:hypothetical protein